MKDNLKKQRVGLSAGFTLVELIVVIAILGILAGVGTVAYSGYVKRANKAVDQQLAGDVKYALQLAAVTPNSNLGTGGSVVLTKDNAPVVKDVSGDTDSDAAKALKAALEAAFGSDWQTTLRLVYDGWDSSSAGSVVLDYTGSTYAGNEAALLSDIQTLTTAMAGVFANNPEAVEAVTGGAFTNYLATKGISGIEGNEQEAANYATLFVADQISQLSDENLQAINNAWSRNDFKYGKDGAAILNGVKMYTEGTGLSTLGAMAVYYANLEAMVTYVNQNASDSSELTAFNQAFQNINTSFAEASSVEDVWNTMATGYSSMVQAAGSNAELIGYITGYGASTKTGEGSNSDAKAFISTMGAVNESADVIGSDMTKENLYGDGTVLNLLTGYISAGEALDGVTNGIAIIAASQGDGSYNIVAYPTDYVK